MKTKAQSTTKAPSGTKVAGGGGGGGGVPPTLGAGKKKTEGAPVPAPAPVKTAAAPVRTPVSAKTEAPAPVGAKGPARATDGPTPVLEVPVGRVAPKTAAGGGGGAVPVKEVVTVGKKPVKEEKGAGKDAGADMVTPGKVKAAVGALEGLQQVEFEWGYWTKGEEEEEPKSVEVTGDWCEWKERVTLEKKEGKWIAVVPLKKGTWKYKFIVDGMWCYDFTKTNEDDGKGNINNVVVVS